MPRAPGNRFLEFIDLIYDCAANPAAWGRFASELSKELGNAAVTLLISDGWETRDDRLFWVGVERNRSFFELRDRDPWAAAYFSGQVGEVTVHREPSPNRVARNAYYRGFMLPQGLGTGPLITITLAQEQDRLEGILSLIARADGPPLRQRELELLRSLAPHLVRARSLCLAIDRDRARDSGFSDVLDQLQIGVILLDETGHPVFANRSAVELLGVADASDTGQRLEQVLTALTGTTGALRIGADDRGSGVALIRSPVDGAPLQLTASNIERGSSRLENEVTSALFLADPRRAAGHPVSVLRALYRLTPAEAQLALLLSTGLVLEDAAKRLRVTVGTARTRLRKIFEKTNTHRQAELLRLLFSGTVPLRGRGHRPSE